MAAKSKFLVLNPSPDDLDKVLAKANLQNSKNGPFEVVLLLGDVLPKESQLPTIALGQPVFFSSGTKGINEKVNELSSNRESTLIDVQQNLAFAKEPLTICKLASGIRIAFLQAEAEKESYHEEIRKQIHSQTTVDILITYSWPKALAKQEQLLLIQNSSFIDEIVQKLQPRYHFAVGSERGRFFENKPYRWNKAVSRFISLGQEGSGDKWFYAFGMGPAEDEEIPSSLAENPYTKPVQVKRAIEETEESKDAVHPKRTRIVTPDQCFFCLSNPKVETHMIVSIGTHSYLTVAKGPLTKPSKELSFSGHAIIIPIEHVPALKSCPGRATELAVFQEMQRFQETLSEAFAQTLLRMVFFEVSRSNNVHAHVQCLPVPEHCLESGFARSLEEKTRDNEEYSKNHPLNFKKFTSEDEELTRIRNECDYVMFTVYRSSTDKTVYVAELGGSEKSVDLQFPRRVLAHLLRTPKRTYWEKCRQSRFKEQDESEAFKAFYKKHDFTL